MHENILLQKDAPWSALQIIVLQQNGKNVYFGMKIDEIGVFTVFLGYGSFIVGFAYKIYIWKDASQWALPFDT